jgi:hypothetical protein
LLGNEDSFKIHCKGHPDVLAERYCTNHRSLICKECAYENHEDDVKKCPPLNQATILSFFRQNLAITKTLKDKINILIEKVEIFIEKEKILTS